MLLDHYIWSLCVRFSGSGTKESQKRHVDVWHFLRLITGIHVTLCIFRNERLLWDSFLCFIKAVFSCLALRYNRFTTISTHWTAQRHLNFYHLACNKTARTLRCTQFRRSRFPIIPLCKSILPFYYAQAQHTKTNTRLPPPKSHMWKHSYPFGRSHFLFVFVLRDYSAWENVLLYEIS